MCGKYPKCTNEGVKLAREGLLDEAIEKLMASITLDPNRADSYVVIGKVYAQKGLYDEPIKEWEKALKIEPDNEQAKIGRRKAEEKKVRSHTNKVDFTYIGSLTCEIGMVLFIVSAFYAIVNQVNLSNRAMLSSAVVMAELGLLSMFVGINMVLKPDRRYVHLLIAPGAVLSLMGIVLFYGHFMKD
ncbi:MAG: hypothetical protein QMD80_09280 [archaeon]|nr:hypothetical protein [archaeon]